MQEKNIVTNKYWSDNERFADIMNVGMFGAKRILSAEQLKEVDSVLSARIGKTETKVGIQKYRDVVKKAAYSMIFAIFGIENQTDIHYAMPVKIMGYDYLDYNKQLQEIRKEHRKNKDLFGAEFLSGFSKEDKINPVCTLVLYYGEEPWDGPTKLSEMMNFNGLPEEIKAVVADYPIHVIDMRRFEDSEKLETDSRLLFGTLQRQDDEEAFEAYRKANQEDFENISDDTFEAIAVLTNSEYLLQYKEQNKNEKGGINVCKAFEQYEKRGKQNEEQRGMRNLIETCQELGSDIELAISKLMSKYQLNRQEAEDKVMECWKS